MIASPFRSRRGPNGADVNTISPTALAKARRLATPFVAALAAAERAVPLNYDDAQGRVFQVLSPDNAGAAISITAQLAWSSRTVLARRTLMLEHQPVESRARKCERVAQPRLPDLPWHPRLRLPNDVSPGALDELLRRARERFEVTLIAGRDIQADPETLKVAAAADGVILLVSADRTAQPEAREALKAVRDAGGEAVGFMMTNYREHVPTWAGGFDQSAARMEAR